ncbi:hypothetical protein PsorP6_003646 [Peronosclerospora sorghi]|uniref:Uncharacterized protein n=1 Tax=Peronosclerospora sorghi TaxID=230839 RepID=A0ACC0VNX3_9STRA|nr:hypothetical protein PsorP6_003646 [Peronosclerospora sorghi]
MENVPSIHLRCSGVRSNPRSSEPSTTHYDFFTESHYSQSPSFIRVNFNSVSFIHRGTHVVERRFVFPGRVLHAVLARFSSQALNTIAQCKRGPKGYPSLRNARQQPQNAPHLCVLVRSDCLNVYSAAGEVFEVALPFQYNQLFPIEGHGLLLQRSPAVQIQATPSKRPRDAAAVALARKNRRSSTSNRGDGDRYNYNFSETGVPTRPRYFTLEHPLDEVKPVAVTSITEKEIKFLSDSALEAVGVVEGRISFFLVLFHREEQRFWVFRLKIAEKNAKSSWIAEVKVVDGQMWTDFRTRNEQRVRIKPHWIAELQWKSPRVGRTTSKPTFLSSVGLSPPVAPPPVATYTSSVSSGSTTKAAFLASNVDGFPLLCLLDKDSGTLLLKPISEDESSAAKDNEETDHFHVMHCRDAVPIRQNDDQKSFKGIKYQDLDGFIDIVVLKRDGALTLYRAHHLICRLNFPIVKDSGGTANGSNDDSSKTVRLASDLELNCIERGIAYEIIFPGICGSLSGKIWRCEHPLKVVSSSLLRQVFDVLEYIAHPKAMCTLKAQVVSRAQLSASLEDELLDSGIEWQSFCECFLDLLPKQGVKVSEGFSSEVSGSVEKKEEMTSSLSPFDALCLSEFHDIYQYEQAMIFVSMELPVTKSSMNIQSFYGNQETCAANAHIIGEQESIRIEKYVENIIAGLHLLCEDLKLSVTRSQERLHLVKLLLEVALQLGLSRFVAYYDEDNCVLKGNAQIHPMRQLEPRSDDLLCFTPYGFVPDIMEWLQSKMKGKSNVSLKFSSLFDYTKPHSLHCGCLGNRDNPLWRTRGICRTFELMFQATEDNYTTAESKAFKVIAYLTQDPTGNALSLDDLPASLRFPIVQAICQVKHNPPPCITPDICAFVGREDLSISSSETVADLFFYSSDSQHQQHSERSKTIDPKNDEIRYDCDGLEDFICRSQPLFPNDQRVKEVARLLRSSRPLSLKLEKTADLSDLDYAQQQQARLLLLCKRSMALPVARGMVTLGSFDICAAETKIWRLCIPALPLEGRKPPTNAIVELDLSGYAKEITYWPQFHNGCATGLRLPVHDLSEVINRHWIKYHRPSVYDSLQGNGERTGANRQTAASQSGDNMTRNLDEAFAAHAGLLLGIGLRGHLKCLSMADIYNYLSLSNEFVTVAIMLGMACTAAYCRRQRKLQATSFASSDDDGQASQPVDEADEMPSLEVDHLFFSGFPELSSSDSSPLLGTGLELALERSVSKMLCLHVPSLLPPPFGGFCVPASIQTAALLGLGILYQGTGHRLMTELLLMEIARSPSSSQFVASDGNAGLSAVSFAQLEGYALAAGMALGLVLLGRGQLTNSGDPGLADLKLEEKLHKYIIGSAKEFRDVNAAGSCLYRGRRWQGFGKRDVTSRNVDGNDGSSGDSTPNGTSRGGTEYLNDRTADEHVNVGVTGAASALALAFMYMQSNNKAVAAQLEVPDTLILLDYVRPDILLVRTLAKNLVMWNSIVPTVEWIERHEIPAQLLQAYQLIHDTREDKHRLAYPCGTPSHADIQSICEAYANISAGACMSIGLRFAGSGHTVARATLRKYVVHFRELRAKASSSSSMLLQGSSNVVAAGTERATVERCLAVCAQALAMIDAGGGNLETLTLLRSIMLRRHVDAAISYGNHMALSMALGLLFLGGGRATISRSKEAIAALVISMYPMFPMNTADNKYHLQAFRHLYVLAVDTSRLLETVDVNTRTTTAVQVHVDLFCRGESAEHDAESSHRVLRTPCLLPDIATIKRLNISDPEYYAVEIFTSPQSHDRPNAMRTANSLRLDLLQNKNVVFLKRRQRNDVRSYLNFTEELGSQSLDQLWRLFRMYFWMINGDEEESDAVADWGRGWWSSQLSSRVLERVSEETQLLLPPYLDALHALFRLQQVPQLKSATEVVELKLFSEYCRLDVFQQPKSCEELTCVLGSGMISKSSSFHDFGVWLSNETEEALGALWHRTPLDITSLASARVQLLTPSMLFSERTKSSIDAFFVSVLMRYFSGPSMSLFSFAKHVEMAGKDWKAKLQRVLAACSVSTPQSEGTNSPARFHLSRFLEQDEHTEAEKTFWLKLVSFFLFSNRHVMGTE